MLKRRKTAILATLFTVMTIALVWGSSYARGLSLVVRAAHIGGWLERTATATTHARHAEPAMTSPTRHGPIPARLYRPNGRYRRVAILTPGVHAMGIDEPRLKGLAGDLAASGVAVMTIALPDLMRYRFTPEEIDEIEDATTWVSSNRELSPDGQVGLMGISFAGGLSMVAAGRPGIRDKVAYVFSFGGHGDLPRVLRYLCSGVEPLPPGAPPSTPPHLRTPHDYGVAVILLGIADRMVPPDQVDALRHGIETYLTASLLTLVDMTKARAVYDESVASASALPEPSRTLMTLVNTRDTKTLGARLLPVLDSIKAYPDSMSPERSPLPKGPVYLLHGTEDTVIPSVESLLLA